MNNSQGTAIVCEFCRVHDVMLEYAGSSTFYGGVYLNPYAFTKWQGEEVIRMYTKVFNIKSGIARFFNVYGPRNPLFGQFTPVVAIFEQQFFKGLPLTIVGDGNQRRDFTHVKDICTGLLAISLKNREAEVYNLGTGVNYSINELADMFGGERKHLPSRSGEARNTLADITKTKEQIGWEPKNDLKIYIQELKNERS